MYKIDMREVGFKNRSLGNYRASKLLLSFKEEIMDFWLLNITMEEKLSVDVYFYCSPYKSLIYLFKYIHPSKLFLFILLYGNFNFKLFQVMVVELDTILVNLSACIMLFYLDT